MPRELKERAYRCELACIFHKIQSTPAGGPADSLGLSLDPALALASSMPAYLPEHSRAGSPLTILGQCEGGKAFKGLPGRAGSQELAARIRIKWQCASHWSHCLNADCLLAFGLLRSDPELADAARKTNRLA